MGKILNRHRDAVRRTGLLLLAAVMMTGLSGCKNKVDSKDEWLSYAALDESETSEELYEKALKEDILVVYSVTTRVTQTKDAFEKAYPGLCVEIRDMRSPNLIEAAVDNYERGYSDCDVILCNDNSGDFKEKIVDRKIAYPYIPADIKDKVKEGTNEGMGSFLNEAEMLFYDGAKYETCPIENIWELTEERFRGKVYMPNPLQSFSTYAFCGASFEHADELSKAYEDYAGEPLSIPGGSNAAEVFWRSLSENIVFTNSSDGVVEAIGAGEAEFGILVSSKLRFKGIGYDLEPVYRLDPFCGCKVTFSVMIARNSKNVNSAKLFVRFLMGEADGNGEGYKPFVTDGTWSFRTDVKDGSEVSMEEMDLLTPDQDYLIANRKFFGDFWAEIISNATGNSVEQ